MALSSSIEALGSTLGMTVKLGVAAGVSVGLGGPGVGIYLGEGVKVSVGVAVTIGLIPTAGITISGVGVGCPDAPPIIPAAAKPAMSPPIAAINPAIAVIITGSETQNDLSGLLAFMDYSPITPTLAPCLEPQVVFYPHLLYDNIPIIHSCALVFSARSQGQR
jgi:hypothetical protein